jgi:hypothetical protein
MRSASPLAIATAAILAACAEPPAAAPMPDVDSVDLSRAGVEPVTGAIDGEPFALADARFRVETFAGREHVDLLLADRAIEQCGLPITRPETLVWARFPGRTSLEIGTFERLEAGTDERAALRADYEVHYERPHAGSLRAVHRGIARIEITSVSPSSIVGRLRICFADVAGSCVGGTFEAAPCHSRIDGRAVREPPGLANEALEPASRGAHP